MANVLATDKQIRIIAALAEGNSIRSIERQTEVHRDTIMRVGVRVGTGSKILDKKMTGLAPKRIKVENLGFHWLQTENQENWHLHRRDIRQRLDVRGNRPRYKGRSLVSRREKNSSTHQLFYCQSVKPRY